MDTHEIIRRFERLERRIQRLEEDELANQAEIDALTAALNQVAEDLAATQTTLQTEINNLANANPELDLSGLTAAVAPLDDSVKALAAIEPVKPEPPAPTPPTVPNQPLYEHTGTGEVDASEWTAIPFTTAPAENGTTEALYTFVGDSPGGEPTGAGPEWTVYTGEAVPAAAS